MVCTRPNSISIDHFHVCTAQTHRTASYMLWTLTMGIPVLLNPFGAEKSTRQRLLKTIQQTEDYIISQQVLYNDSLNTCNKDTVLFPISRMPHFLCLFFKISVASGRDKAPSHRNVTLWKWPPMQSVLGKCLLKRSHPNWIRWYQAETYSKENMREHDVATTVLYRKLYMVTEKQQKVANNAWSGGGHFQGGWMLMAT